MSKHFKRVLVKLHKKNGEAFLAKFPECILQFFELSGKGEVQVCLRDNCLEISDDKFADSHKVVIKHPSFCPVFHLTPEMIAKLPPETMSRGVDVGAAVLLESCDGQILLSRRARHLSIFPGLWVPPGGHVEENESLLEAGLRELHEETGLKLSPGDCVGGKIDLLALWESVFPPKLSVGPPKRHHIVVYFHARLVEGLTAAVLEKRLNFDPGEVDACAWMDRKLIKSIVESDDERENSPLSSENSQATYRAVVLDKDKNQCCKELSTAPLFRVHSDNADEEERVSTGTKFALEQFLNIHPLASL